MASEAQARARSLVVDPVWPPDDTEESIVGVDLHQRTILSSRLGINEAALLAAEPGAQLPWYATDQVLLLGCLRPDGTAYRTMPDVFVFPHPIDPLQGSFSLAQDGPPVLIIEVLSESTYAWDLDLERGKGYSYARAGVQEYLTLDPTYQWLPGGGQGWRLVQGAYQPWERDEAGRWRCESIGVSIGLEGTMVTIHTHAGVAIPLEGQIMATLAHKDAQHASELARKDAQYASELARKDAQYASELARKDAQHAAELARQSAELEELRRQLEELRGGS
jgi:Uma2 family endonuclease